MHTLVQIRLCAGFESSPVSVTLVLLLNEELYYIWRAVYFEQAQDNPLQTLLPVPDEVLEEFFTNLGSGNASIVALYNGKIVGVRTGSVLSYKEFKKVNIHQKYKKRKWKIILGAWRRTF